MLANVKDKINMANKIIVATITALNIADFDIFTKFRNFFVSEVNIH
jgi:hypothetical protein